MAFCISSPQQELVVNTMPSIKHTAERADLEKVLRDTKARNRLMLALAKSEEHKASVRPLRFCVAADEYLQLKNAVERKQKARKMVGVFVQNGSMFQLQDLPEEMQRAFLAEKFAVIAQAREHYSRQLALDDSIKQTIKDLDLL